MTARRVLIVDDSLTVRMDLDEAFRDAGYETALCAAIADARADIARRLPDLVVLDVVLPDGDGVEFLVELRTNAETANLPVVLLSSEADVADRVRGLSLGANEYVGKPYDADWIIARASELFRASRTSERTAPVTVLIIDDSVTFREELAELLEGAGYKTIRAASGEEGLQKASRLHPDAIIVDGVMPGLDGPGVIRRIRLDPGLNSTPCLLLTGSEGAASEVTALDAGADAFVRKTDRTDLILARFNAMIRGAQASRDRDYATSLLAPKRILAVDDSLTYLEGLADLLHDDGYEVIKARSGAEALELVSVEKVDCILLDVLMPGLSGYETCRRIKTSPVSRNIPLIMLTSLQDGEAMVEGINSGADDYVSKSADIDVLKARLRAQLRRKQFEDENRKVRDELLRTESEAQAAREIARARQVLLDEISAKNHDLAVQAEELQRLNTELETFAYAVSHDLRQPLRAMDGFSRVLLERYAESLDERGQHYLGRVRAGAERMTALIDGLLALSRVSRGPIQRRPLRLDELAATVLERLRVSEPQRSVEVRIQPGLEATGEPSLIESALENLLGNAWKFTSHREHALIEVGGEGEVFFVRDNGAGFDTTYADKLFEPFGRLHSEAEFAGTGIGLATVDRILRRHGGRIWAESVLETGTTFYFSIPHGEGS